MKFFRLYKNLVPFNIWDQKYENAFIFLAGDMQGEKTSIESAYIYSCLEDAENAIKKYKKYKWITGNHDIYSCGKWYIELVEKTLCNMINNKELKIVKQGIMGGKRYVL